MVLFRDHVPFLHFFPRENGWMNNTDDGYKTCDILSSLVVFTIENQSMNSWRYVGTTGSSYVCKFKFQNRIFGTFCFGKKKIKVHSLINSQSKTAETVSP